MSNEIINTIFILASPFFKDLSLIQLYRDWKRYVEDHDSTLPLVNVSFFLPMGKEEALLKDMFVMLKNEKEPT